MKHTCRYHPRRQGIHNPLFDSVIVVTDRRLPDKQLRDNSMKQAIEEGFILDVLANYTTYKSYYEIEKSIKDNPEFNTTKAQKKLKAYVESHAQTIGTKSEIMLDHFITKQKYVY